MIELIDPRVWPGVIALLALLLMARIFRSRFFSILIFFILFFHLSFFRDLPPRIPEGDSLLSPASGKVVLVDTVAENRFLKEEAWRIRIFLALWNVHVTRSPMEGEVAYQEHVPGKHINVLLPESADKNESNWIGIKDGARSALVRQITGAIARRIYSDVEIGSVVTRGGKLGIICYGSTVEIFVPKRLFEPSIRKGEGVRTGETVIGKWIG
ncbi:MAG TPA: phosphatidylserine decarboxylase [Candidatus Omnitrophota bacterium]|jgi:phosphatidylserine decarboxylase|nr:phosphatidylserine decarboxylase [Candidatus Omnitrophota bacterium]HQB12439.1 phosphatidylserine decarboxylase [Candidatus Omnitrophota bacterium]